MMNLLPSRLGALLLLSLPVVASMNGCSAASDVESATEGCSATADGAVFVQSVNTLQAQVNALQTSLGAACYQIADAGGMAPSTWGGQGQPSDDQLQDACNAANTVITGLGSGSITISVGQPVCQASLTATGECEAMCSGGASCTGASAMATCMGGQISGQCSGMCEAGATCDGSASLAVACSGACTGSCQGTITGGCQGACNGTCTAMDNNGNCTGTCTGTCTPLNAQASCSGQCSGSCTVTASGGVMCSAGATCTGSCSGTVTAPTCTGTITPPACNVSAQCSSSCNAQVQASATCTPPTVNITATGSADANVVSALQAALPQIYLAAKQAPALVTTLSNAGSELTSAISGSLGCASELATLVGLPSSLSVSVSVSVMVSGSASAQGG